MTDFTKIFRRTTYPKISPLAPSNDQSGRTILVTGASEGVGFGISKAFAEAHSDRVIILSRSQTKLDKAKEAIKDSNPKVTVLTRECDASDVSQVATLWERLSDDGLFVDVLVLNAARAGEAKSFSDATSFFHFNIVSNMHMIDHFQKQRNPDSKPKCLINISSAALQCYPYVPMAYAASKAGFANYLCHLADLVAENEMRVINLHPGAVYTNAAAREGEVPRELPIWDHPSLSANMAVWTAGQDSAFLHGRFIWANYDAEELIGMKDAILADPAFLKVGITGVNTFSVPKLMKKCEEVSVPSSGS